MAKSKSSKKTGTKTDTASSKKRTARTEPVSREPVSTIEPHRREVGGVIFAALAVFVVISYFTSEGAFIVWFSNFLKGMLGVGYWVTAPVFLWIAYRLFFHNGQPVALKVFSGLMLPILFSALVNLFIYDADAEMDLTTLADDLFTRGIEMKSGGAAGGLIHIGLERAFSVYGAFAILLILFVVFLLILMNCSISAMKDKVQEAGNAKYQPVTARNIDRRATAADDFYLTDEEAESDPRPVQKTTRARNTQSAERRVFFPADLTADEAEDDTALPLNQLKPAPVKTAAGRTKNRKKTPDVSPTEGVEPLTEEEAANIAGVSLKTEPEPAPESDADDFVSIPMNNSRRPARATAARTAPAEVRQSKKEIVKTEVDAEAAAVEAAVEASSAAPGADEDQYEFPPVSILHAAVTAAGDSRDEVHENERLLNKALKNFGVDSQICNITHGPTVTRYDIELHEGVKLSKVTNLAGDLALALGVVNVRIAPIPDKIATVGIEVPNKSTSTVYLREIIESARFTTAKSKVSFAIGKDIGGNCIVGNIAKLPHMLIAGTTGSGKSVCMNSLILSLLYKARPDEVKLIMVDPKMVELGVYNGIPHLLVPVVTDPKKAAGALQWSVVEMLKRYRLFSEVGVRDLEAYNHHCEANDGQKLPQVVIVIDELADLMLVASKEVEESICRVAQMGRAAGMHLVIATQRPSADVITGLMKANIPSRIAFAVSSAMESRIILDQGGAEKLIGMGDMLYAPVGCGKPTRIQGAYVSDEEREEVIGFIKQHTGELTQETNSEIDSYMNKAAEDKNSGDGGKAAAADSPAGDYDEMLPQAVEAVLETKMCSVSMLQRRVKLGYSRAARIVDQMEELGVVGPYQGAKPREVIIDRQGWHDLQVQLGMASDDDMSLAEEMNAEE